MRVFCRYLNDIGIPAYIPPKGISEKTPRYAAHIYTDEELKKFLPQLIKTSLSPVNAHTEAMSCLFSSGFCIPAKCGFQNFGLPGSKI